LEFEELEFGTYLLFGAWRLEFIMNGGFLHPETIVKEFGVRVGMSVADFGCGTGYFTIDLARAVGDEGRVYAFDIQQSALESVRSRAQEAGLFNIETLWSDLEIPGGSKLPERSQDRVLAANILFQTPDKTAVLNEAKRVVKPDGKVIVIDWLMATPLGPKKEYRVPQETIIRMAQGAGLKKEREFQAGEYHYGIVFTPTA